MLKFWTPNDIFTPHWPLMALNHTGPCTSLWREKWLSRPFAATMNGFLMLWSCEIPVLPMLLWWIRWANGLVVRCFLGFWKTRVELMCHVPCQVGVMTSLSCVLEVNMGYINLWFRVRVNIETDWFNGFWQLRYLNVWFYLFLQVHANINSHQAPKGYAAAMRKAKILWIESMALVKDMLLRISKPLA